MKLSESDVELFFNLMWSLQKFVNLKLGIPTDISTFEKYQNLSSSVKISEREMLYDNIELIDSYLLENPQQLSDEELEIIAGWKKVQRGDFFIERFLKKYAIFISGDTVYAVLAIYQPFEDLLPYVKLPYYVNAVLLPFKGKIIYDGLLQGYNIVFGKGIKFDLKDTYMAAKQKGQIIISFNPEIQAKAARRKKKPIKDWGPAINDISGRAKKLRSSSGAPAIHSPAFSLAKASIEFARLAVEDPENIDELWRALEKVERAIGRADSVLYRAR